MDARYEVTQFWFIIELCVTSDHCNLE